MFDKESATLSSAQRVYEPMNAALSADADMMHAEQGNNVKEDGFPPFSNSFLLQYHPLNT